MKLLFENWRSYLKELENISDVSMPKKFYISIYFDDSYRPDIMKDLGDNKVIKTPGASSSDIVGFADNPSNFMQMHGNIRDATIVMDGKDFAEINDSIVKIEYENPDFLTQDGLKAFYRLTEKNQDSQDHAESVIGSIFGSAEIGESMWKVTREKVDNQSMVTMQNFLGEWDTKTPFANAANSLLKTLEEPRKNTLIILLAHNINLLPKTILSRCQTIHINPTYDQESADWLSNQITENTRDDFDSMQLLESSHGVPQKALDDLKGDYFLKYQSWQNLLLEIVLSPTKISNTDIFVDHELEVLKCLQHLLNEAIKIKVLDHEGANLELNQVVEKTSFNNLFKLLDDTNRAISMAQTTINIKLLLDNVLVVWSHITNLKKYPAITNIQEY